MKFTELYDSIINEGKVDLMEPKVKNQVVDVLTDNGKRPLKDIDSADPNHEKAVKLYMKLMKSTYDNAEKMVHMLIVNEK